MFNLDSLRSTHPNQGETSVSASIHPADERPKPTGPEALRRHYDARRPPWRSRNAETLSQSSTAIPLPAEPDFPWHIRTCGYILRGSFEPELHSPSQENPFAQVLPLFVFPPPNRIHGLVSLPAPNLPRVPWSRGYATAHLVLVHVVHGMEDGAGDASPIASQRGATTSSLRRSPALGSACIRRPGPITDLRRKLTMWSANKWKDLDGIVLVGHSYGGMVITEHEQLRNRASHPSCTPGRSPPADGQSLFDITHNYAAADSRFRQNRRA